MVSLSLFAGLERILRRFSIFAGGATQVYHHTTIEPCNPVFKEVPPRPSYHNQYYKALLSSQSNSSCHAVHLLY